MGNLQVKIGNLYRIIGLRRVYGLRGFSTM
jgi:hypothetical protein